MQLGVSMSRADKYLVCGILLVAIVSAVFQYFQGLAQLATNSPCYAVIMAQGKRAAILELSEGKGRQMLSLQGKIGPATVEEDGCRIRMLEAPCPDRICIRRGWIEKSGDSIICIPNEIHIFMQGNGVAPVDALTR